MKVKYLLKNNIIRRSLWLVFLLLMVFVSCNNSIITNIVDADSGFDSSWDSGSDFDSSWDSDYGSSSSGGGGGDPRLGISIFYTIFIIFVYFIICCKLINVKSKEYFPLWFTLPYVILYLISIYYLFGDGYLCGCYIFSSLVMYIYCCMKYFGDGDYFRAPLWFTILYWLLFLISIYVFFEQYFIVTAFITVATIIMIIIDGRRFRKNALDAGYISLSEEQIYKKLGNDFNIEEFNLRVFEIYRDIQIAWMNRNVEPVRHLLSDEMFNMYRTQLATLIAKNQKNIMEDFEFIDACIIDVSNNKGKEQIKVKLHVTCRDYLVDSNDNVIRGDKHRINDYTYQLVFVRSQVSSDVKKCLSCGAPLDNSVSTKCEYCGSVIIRESDNFVMTDKKMLKQVVKEYK